MRPSINSTRMTHISSRMEALASRQIADPLACELARAHHLDDIKARPADVVSAHLQLKKCFLRYHKNNNKVFFINESMSHVCQFGNGIAFDVDVIDAQLLLDLFETLSDIVRLRRENKADLH